MYHPLNEQAMLQQAHDHGELLTESFQRGHGHRRWWRRETRRESGQAA